MKTQVYWSKMPSELGDIAICCSEEAVLSVEFTEEPIDEAINPPDIVVKTKKQLQGYFNGTLKAFALKLDPAGTEFQQKVWNELAKIPFGKTINYLELANKLGDPKVIRAAASANGKNPIAVIIPCHRVIGKSGKLVGYAGGLPRKKFLLDLENKIANGVQMLF